MTTNPTNNAAPTTGEGTIPATPFHYFVSVLAVSATGISTMQVEVSRSRPVRTMHDVQDLQKWIRHEYSVPEAQVMGVSLLRNDLANPQRGQR
jgi:hypothetical protein